MACGDAYDSKQFHVHARYNTVFLQSSVIRWHLQRLSLMGCSLFMTVDLFQEERKYFDQEKVGVDYKGIKQLNTL
jgi:hypothetical protein